MTHLGTTAQNIILWKDSGTPGKSHKGRGQKPLLNVYDLRAFKLRNHRATLVTWWPSGVTESRNPEIQPETWKRGVDHIWIVCRNTSTVNTLNISTRLSLDWKQLNSCSVFVNLGILSPPSTFVLPEKYSWSQIFKLQLIHLPHVKLWHTFVEGGSSYAPLSSWKTQLQNCLG